MWFFCTKLNTISFSVCSYNVSGVGAAEPHCSPIVFRKCSRTSICILSLLDMEKFGCVHPSCRDRRSRPARYHLIRIDFPLSVFLGNQSAPPFRRAVPRLTSCLSSNRYFPSCRSDTAKYFTVVHTTLIDCSLNYFSRYFSFIHYLFYIS